MSVAVTIIIGVVILCGTRLALWLHRYWKKSILIANLFPSKADLEITAMYGTLTAIAKNREKAQTLALDMQLKRMEADGVASSIHTLFKLISLVNLYHPEAASKALSVQSGKGFGYNTLNEWLGDGLLVSKGSKWQRHRKLLTPVFHFDILKSYFASYHRAADILLDKLEPYADSGKTWSVGHDIALCTLDILMECIFGQVSDIQIGEGSRYSRAVMELTQLTTERFFLHPLLATTSLYYWTKTGRRYQRLCDVVHEVSDQLIDERRKLKESGEQESQRFDFLDIMLDAKDETGGLSNEAIRNEVDTFMFEGHDTTSSAISWAVHSLARYAKYQEDIYEEIQSNIGLRSPTSSDLPKLQKLNLFLKECLRLFPPVPAIQRKLEDDLEVSGKVIPKGTTLAISIFAMQRNKLVWGEDASEFKPERFAEGGSGSVVPEHPYAYIPFAAGPRNCIGQNFALHEIKVMIVKILQRYRLTLSSDEQLAPVTQLTLKTEDGNWHTLLHHRT